MIHLTIGVWNVRMLMDSTRSDRPQRRTARVDKSIWTASSEFGTYRLCEQRRFRRACASAQSRQNLRCSLIQAVSQEEPSDRKPDPWLLWMAGHAQLKFVMTECSKTQIRLTGLIWSMMHQRQFMAQKSPRTNPRLTVQMEAYFWQIKTLFSKGRLNTMIVCSVARHLSMTMPSTDPPDRDVNWRPPVQGESTSVQVKEPYSSLHDYV